MTLENNLRMIEEALEKYNELSSGEMGFDGVANEALQALSSLRSLLEGDAGEDEKKIAKLIFDTRKKYCYNYVYEDKLRQGCKCPNCLQYGELEIVLLRLSAKAKVGEAEIREVKREVFKEIWGQWIALGNLPEFIEWLHEQLAVLDKEAGT